MLLLSQLRPWPPQARRVAADHQAIDSPGFLAVRPVLPHFDVGADVELVPRSGGLERAAQLD